MWIGPWMYLTGRPTPAEKRAQAWTGVSFSKARVTLIPVLVGERQIL